MYVGSTGGAGESRSLVAQKAMPDALYRESTMLLERVLEAAPATIFASLASLDGRSLGYAGRPMTTAGQRLAAMTSSLLALSDSMVKEGLDGRCAYTVLASPQGTVVLAHVPSTKQGFVLSMGADTTENVAMILRRTLDTAAALATLLDA